MGNQLTLGLKGRGLTAFFCFVFCLAPLVEVVDQFRFGFKREDLYSLFLRNGVCVCVCVCVYVCVCMYVCVCVCMCVN